MNMNRNLQMAAGVIAISLRATAVLAQEQPRTGTMEGDMMPMMEQMSRMMENCNAMMERALEEEPPAAPAQPEPQQ